VIEKEADDAEVGLVVVEIELGTGGHMRRENFRIDGEVEHGEVTPVRGQKRLQHRSRGSGIRDQRSELRGQKPDAYIETTACQGERRSEDRRQRTALG
jgi:hypothetical protein